MSKQASDDDIAWPEKKGELYHNHFDSSVWNDFPFRDDDIFISTYAKSGTTWIQQILAQLLFNGATDINVADMSPWFDFRLPPREVKLEALEAQTHRRFIKTHLPVDALVYSPKAKYLYIARDGRDVLWSYYNHHSKHNDLFYREINSAGSPGIEPAQPPQLEVHEYFRHWLANDGYPLWRYWHNIRTWWEIRHLPNLMLLHFSALKADMPGEIRRIAAFLDIPIDESKWDAILEHCSFEYMRANAESSVPLGGAVWEGGAKTFIHKGTNGRWRDILTEQDNTDYESRALGELGEDCAAWLASGELATTA
jgi:aryl sulfotransferase